METMTHDNLVAYLMEADQDLTLRQGQVYDAAGEVVAQVQRPSAAGLITKCCANCKHSQKTKDFWGNVLYICHRNPAVQVTVSATHLCDFHAGPDSDPDLGLSYDIWT